MPAAVEVAYNGTDAAGGTVLADDDALQIDWSGADDLVPPFPHELASGKEPLLLLKKGQVNVGP
jgi:hypothetical protein